MISEALIRELLRTTPAVATVTGRNRGFALFFDIGGRKQGLMTSRGKLRLFASIDTASDLLRSLGIRQFTVDTSGHRAGRLRKARPDRAEAMRRTATRMKQQPLSL